MRSGAGSGPGAESVAVRSSTPGAGEVKASAPSGSPPLSRKVAASGLSGLTLKLLDCVQAASSSVTLKAPNNSAQVATVSRSASGA